MSGLNRAIKACILFIIGLYLQHVFIVGDSWLILISRCASILILANLLYLYGSTYKNKKLPENDLLVTIIGAGASGIAMAIKLKELGVRFRLLEKGQRLGGTWWYNQYPGCACDVGSVMYSYSFELNPDWSRSHSGHQEILQYLENTADKYGIKEHIEYEKCVENTVWDSATKTWRVELQNGEVFVCNIIVSGVGILHVPSKPTFAGADTFRGEVFHSAEWPQGWDPAGKRVAVIGTGASAVQIVPTIADKVESMTVFQRTATWIMPKDDYPIRHFVRVLFRLCPFLFYFMRIQMFWRLELM